jgi:hypothetical protein
MARRISFRKPVSALPEIADPESHVEPGEETMPACWVARSRVIDPVA